MPVSSYRVVSCIKIANYDFGQFEIFLNDIFQVSSSKTKIVELNSTVSNLKRDLIESQEQLHLKVRVVQYTVFVLELLALHNSHRRRQIV